MGEKKQHKRKKSLKTTWIQVSVLPILLLGILLTILSARTLRNGMTQEISDSLSVAAHSLYNTYSLIAPGDYVMEDGVLKKGDIVITGDHRVIDALKESYDMEITLFYGDERAITTITDQNGKRLDGTKTPPEIAKWVLEKNRKYFTTNVKINNEDYYGYYVPILNRDQTVVGMAFAGKTARAVKRSVRSAMIRSILISLIFILIALLASIAASQNLIESLHLIVEYLAKTDFSQKMSDKVLKRDDEIGEMGRRIVVINKSLEEMVTKDPLTKLLNRRACHDFLNKKIELCKRNQENRISVALGDIDFFKRINDQYGHECGDIVLVKVSEVFQKHFQENGAVARWGGEEFLFIFEKPLAEAKQEMQNILNEIRSIIFEYGGTRFRVTLSIGMNGEIVESNFDEIIKIADDMLYQGKEGGRNRIVTAEGEVILPPEA